MIDVANRLKRSFEENYNRWYKRAIRITHSHEMSEDAIQEACSRALRWSGSYNKEKPFDDWMSAILNNAIYAIVNEERRGGVKIEFKEDFITSHKMDEWSQDIVEKVKSDIKTLEDQKREVATLYFLHGYTPRDICQIVGMTNNAVRQFIKRFKKVLGEKYGS
jgi:RNA polymerase sigma factor (sigma-70 family)